VEERWHLIVLFPSLREKPNSLNSVRCDLYLDRQAVDTTTPAGRALFQMLGVFADLEDADRPFGTASSIR
jgi:DNA invertase Pin-like site-specific DNA recombinase